MTVLTSTSSVIYRGNGATTEFAVPFKVLDEDHLRIRRRVFATGAIDYTYVGTDYSYVGLGAPNGTLTLAGTALDDDYELVIERIVPYTQDLDIVNAGGFYPEAVEEQLDLMTMGIQQLADTTDRIVEGDQIDPTLRVQLAGPLGSTMIGHNSGTLADAAPLVAATPDDILTAALISRNIILIPDNPYVLDDVLDLSAVEGLDLDLNGAEISAAVGFPGTHLITARADAHIHNGRMVGTNLADPFTNWVNVLSVTRGATTLITVDEVTGFREGEAIVMGDIAAIPATADLGGTVELNGNTYYAHNVAADGLSFEIQDADGDLDSSAFGAFTGGGTATLQHIYAAGAYQGAAIFWTGDGGFGLIEKMEFEDFPAGPILKDSRVDMTGLMVDRCRFINVQTYTLGATNAVVAFHGVYYGRQRDCHLEGFTWKGYYLSESYHSTIEGCDSLGGTDGHASHYISGGAYNSILESSQTGVAGVGFGFKLSDTKSPTVKGFKAINARSGGQVQGAEDFLIDGMEVWNSSTSSLFIEASSTYGANTRGKVTGFRGRRSTPGTVANHRGILIQGSAKVVINITNITKANPAVVTAPGHDFHDSEAVAMAAIVGMVELNGNTYFIQNPDPEAGTFELRTATGALDTSGGGYTAYVSGGTASVGGAVDRLAITESYFENYLYGIHAAENAFQQTNIELISNEFFNCSQYCALLFIGSGRILGNKMHLDGAATNANLFIARDGVSATGVIEVNDNEFSLASGSCIQLGVGERVQYDQVRLTNNRCRGGARLLDLDLNNNVADFINQLVITGNTGTGLTPATANSAADGLNITFNDTTVINAVIRENALLGPAPTYTPMPDAIWTPTPANITWRRTPFTGSNVVDVASIAAGATATVTITVTGARVGDTPYFWFGAPTLEAGLAPSAKVTAADTVELYLKNTTGGAINPASRTYNAGAVP